MKAVTARIKINDQQTLKVLLVPEDEKELVFLRETAALDDLQYAVSWQDGPFTWQPEQPKE